MSIARWALVAFVMAGCAGAAPAPGTASLEEARSVCNAQAAAALYPSALPMPTPAQRSYPWTAGRTWPQNSPEERLRERDIFESCMAQHGYPVSER